MDKFISFLDMVLCGNAPCYTRLLGEVCNNKSKKCDQGNIKIKKLYL